MEKIINPIDKDIYGNGRHYPVFMKIKFEDGKLSITGVEGPMSSGDCRGGCGQIDIHLKEEDRKAWRFTKGWNMKMMKKLFDIWDEWHLNNLKAGCEHQRALGWEKEGYDKHPSEPCPTCGYKFGTAWNKVDVPQDVIDWLFSLPSATKTPAWV